VIRRLIKKGLPSHVGIVFMLSAPIINPVVYASTYFAFKSSPCWGRIYRAHQTAAPFKIT
jgi:uncharacterized membrane protein YraQ (UPF0718 family)